MRKKNTIEQATEAKADRPDENATLWTWLFHVSCWTRLQALSMGVLSSLGVSIALASTNSRGLQAAGDVFACLSLLLLSVIICWIAVRRFIPNGRR